MKQKYVIIFLLFIPTISFSAVSNPTKAFLLSLLLPGGGQYYNGSIVKGVLISSTEIALGYGVYHYNKIMDEAKALGDRGKFVSSRRSRNDFIWALVGVVFLSSLDAYVDSQLRDFDVKISYIYSRDKTPYIFFRKEIK